MHEGKWPLHTSLFYQAPTDLDVGVFHRVDARESLPHHAPEKSALAPGIAKSVNSFALGQS